MSKSIVSSSSTMSMFQFVSKSCGEGGFTVDVATWNEKYMVTLGSGIIKLYVS